MRTKSAATAERAIVMAEMYLSGKTAKEIAREFNVTGECVRLNVRKAGIGRADGGVTVKAKRRAAGVLVRRAERWDSRSNRLYGCSREEVLELNEGRQLSDKDGLARAYQQHRANTIKRDLEWGLTFPEWVRIWKESGRLNERGRGCGYVMARHGDTGGYVPGNVYICTASQNIIDGWAFKPASARNIRRKSAA